MRRSYPFGRYLAVPLLLLALVHAWTPRVLWHWHDCGHSLTKHHVTTGCAATCLHEPSPSPHLAHLPAWQNPTDSHCGFSFDSFHLPKADFWGWQGLPLLHIGLVQPAAWQVPQPGLASTIPPTGRAPPTCH